MFSFFPLCFSLKGCFVVYIFSLVLLFVYFSLGAMYERGRLLGEIRKFPQVFWQISAKTQDITTQSVSNLLFGWKHRAKQSCNKSHCGGVAVRKFQNDKDFMKSFKLLWSLPLIERHLMGKGNCNILYIVAVLTNDYYIYGDKCGWPTINYQVLPLCTHFGEITRLFLDKAQLSKINVGH